VTGAGRMQSATHSRITSDSAATPKVSLRQLHVLPPEQLFTVTVGCSRSIARFCVDVCPPVLNLWSLLCRCQCGFGGFTCRGCDVQLAC
jgi:hypothetical protein